MRNVIDYSADFPDALAAQGSGKLFTAVFKLDKPIEIPGSRAKAQYEVLQYFLARDCKHADDQAWRDIQGSRFAHLQRKDMPKRFQAEMKRGSDLSNHFSFY